MEKPCNFIRYISKILENLDPCKDSKFCLSDENLYVTISKHQAHKYVGFHRGASGDGSGVTLDMDQWGEFLEYVAESVIEELIESHPNFHDLEIRDLICLCYVYILERDIIARPRGLTTTAMDVNKTLPVNEITWNLAV